jgi:hypothetical protein
MRAEESIQHQTCPPDIEKWLILAGGLNRYGGPKFRIVWGYDRIVPITGSWEEWDEQEVPDLHPLARPGAMRKQIRLIRSVVETRQVPKYLPGNCWHLECWRPPEEYGTPESWRKAGEEVYGGVTVDTAGEFPSMGDYELVMPLTTTGTYQGEPIPLCTEAVAYIVQMIRRSKEDYTMSQRKAAIEQAAARKDNEFTRVTVDKLKDNLRPFAGETFISVPGHAKP